MCDNDEYNIWYDKRNKIVYKNSELGQPVKITTFTNMPSNITLDDVDSEKAFANVEFYWEYRAHLDHERHGVDSAGRVGTRHVLDDGSENDERGTRPECDERIEKRENVLVVDERRHDHRDGRR